jgi:hypothetical protein
MSKVADFKQQVCEAVSEYRKEHGGKLPKVGHVFVLEDVRTYLGPTVIRHQVCESDILPATVEVMYDGRLTVATVKPIWAVGGHVTLEWETPDGTKDRCLCTTESVLKAVEKREAVVV